MKANKSRAMLQKARIITLLFWSAHMYPYAQNSDSLTVLNKINTIDSLIKSDDIDNAAIEMDLLANIVKKINLSSISIANGLSEIGSLWMKKYRFEEATESYLLSKAIFENELGTSNAFVEGTLKNLGVIAWRKGEFKLSLQYFQDCLLINQTLFGKESEQAAKMLNNIGVVQSDLGWYGEAIESLKSSMAIKQKLFGEEHPSLTTNLLNIGALYNEKKDHRKAKEMLTLANKLAEKTLLKEDPLFGKIYSNLAATYLAVRDYGNAIGYHQKGIENKIKAHGENSLELADSYSNISGVYSESRQLDKAVHFAQKAFDIRRSILEPSHYSIGVSYHHLGNIYYLQDSFKMALDAYNKAIMIVEEGLGQANTYLPESYYNIGVILQKTGQFESALNSYKKGLVISSQINSDNNFYSIRTKGDMAEVYIKMDSIHLALRCFEELEQDSRYEFIGTDIRKIIAPNFLLDALVKKAKFLWNGKANNNSRSNLQKAAETYQSALAIEDLLIDNYQEGISKSDLFSIRKPLFENIMSFEVRHSLLGKNTGYLFELSEKTKSLSLLETVNNYNAMSFGGIPNHLLEKEYELKVDINYLKNRIFEEENQVKNVSDSAIIRLNSRLFDLKNEHFELIQLFNQKYKQYFELKYQNNQVNVETLQNTILKEGQTLLEYFVGDSTIFAFVIKKDLYHVEEIELDFPLKDWVDTLRSLIQQPSLKPGPYIEVAANLYDKIMRPVAHLLTDTSLVIIPDGALCYLPFDALLTERPQNARNYTNLPYLLHRHAISYCYSATLLRLMQEKAHRLPPTHDLVAFAPWAEGISAGVSDRRGAIAPHPDSLGTLAHSKAETEYIATLTGGVSYFNEEATKRQFLQSADLYRIVFLSLHGVANESAGDKSWLAFFNLRSDPDSTLLYVRDIYNLQLNTDLVFLSACETSMGEMQKGEGIIGLSRAFAYAGAKSIVSALWQANDYATAEISKRFFKCLKTNGMQKDRALRQAKLDFLLENPGTSQPFFWATLIPIGDMQALWQ